MIEAERRTPQDAKIFQSGISPKCALNHYIVQIRREGSQIQHGCNALRTPARQAWWIGLVLGDRAKSRAHSHSISTDSSIKIHSSTAPAPPSGAVANLPPCWRSTPGSRWGAKVSDWS